MLIHIEKPMINKDAKPEEAIAIIDRWMAETSEKINVFVEDIEKRMGDKK